jgi:hypothetical protein
MTDYTLLRFVAPFFTLRELCKLCVYVCQTWQELVYTDVRWITLNFTELQITTNARVDSLALRSSLPLVKEMIVKCSKITGQCMHFNFYNVQYKIYSNFCY